MNFDRISNDSIVLMDVDGTLKDLIKENTEALVLAMKRLGGLDKTKRGKIVLAINKVNMYLVKTGFLPTNKTMQNLLLLIYSILLFKEFTTFKIHYYIGYNKQHIFFQDLSEMLDGIYNSDSRLCFVSKNQQNKTIVQNEALGKFNAEIVVGKKEVTKYNLYKSLIAINKFEKENIVIIGDNLIDDVIPALLLGINVVWVDMYDCKVKRVLRSVLSVLCKRIINN